MVDTRCILINWSDEVVFELATILSIDDDPFECECGGGGGAIRSPTEFNNLLVEMEDDEERGKRRDTDDEQKRATKTEGLPPKRHGRYPRTLNRSAINLVHYSFVCAGCPMDGLLMETIEYRICHSFNGPRPSQRPFDEYKIKVDFDRFAVTEFWCVWLCVCVASARNLQNDT